MKDYLCFTAEQAGSTIKLRKIGSSSINIWNGYYSNNGSDWNSYTYDYEIVLNNIGDKVYFKGNILEDQTTVSYIQFQMTGKIAASGNIMSFCCGEDFEEQFTIPHTYNFLYLFGYCDVLTSSPYFPATTLAEGCYQGIFKNCSSLKNAPQLPATVLTSNCYTEMFLNCTQLKTAPILPSLNMAYGCYLAMFKGCTSLEIAPDLPSTELWDACYKSMFNGCTSLQIIPELPATELEYECYRQMFSGCSKLYVSATSGTVCQNVWRIPKEGVFSGTANTQNNMFASCLGTRSSDSITSTRGTSYTFYTQIPPGERPKNYLCFTAEEANSTLELSQFRMGNIWRGSYSTDGFNWISYSHGTTITLQNIGDKVYFKGTLSAALSEGNYQYFRMTGSIAASGNIMSFCCGDNFENNYELPVAYTFYLLFSNCTALTSAPELPATTLQENCYRNMFSGTSITTIPELPAHYFELRCYDSMFVSCLQITTVDIHIESTDIDIPGSFSKEMFFNCSSLNEVHINIEFIDKSIFQECTNLQNVYFYYNNFTKDEYFNEINGAYAFYSCSSLTHCDDFNVHISNCDYMFSRCTSLIHSPQFYRMVGSCVSMFQYCTSLINAPVFLIGGENSTFVQTFQWCTNLLSPPILFTINPEADFFGIFVDCKSLEYPSTNYTPYFIPIFLYSGTKVSFSKTQTSEYSEKYRLNEIWNNLDNEQYRIADRTKAALNEDLWIKPNPNRQQLQKFYWNGTQALDDDDTIGIKTGLPVTNLKGSAWEEFLRYLNAIGTLFGYCDYDPDEPDRNYLYKCKKINSSQIFYATLFNMSIELFEYFEQANLLTNIPSLKTSYSSLMSADFNGTNSIKDQLNKLIDYITINKENIYYYFNGDDSAQSHGTFTYLEDEYNIFYNPGPLPQDINRLSNTLMRKESANSMTGVTIDSSHLNDYGVVFVIRDIQPEVGLIAIYDKDKFLSTIGSGDDIQNGVYACSYSSYPKSIFFDIP